MKLRTSDPMSSYQVYNINELKELVVETLQDDENTPLLIMGAPGIGKTAILRDALSELPDGNEWNLVVKTLSTETPDNFFLPKYTNSGEGCTDIPKDWLPVYRASGDPTVDSERDKNCGKGLLFIDELSRTVPQVLNVCLGLVHERSFNGYNVGTGWKIICASNRPEDEMVGQSDLSNALQSRFGLAYFEPSPEEWCKWASSQPHIPPIFLQWIMMKGGENLSGGKYFYWDPNEEEDLSERAHTFCMPRTWDNGFKKLAKKHPSGSLVGFNLLDLSDETIKRVLNRFIPSTPINVFCEYLVTIRAVGDFHDILDKVWKGSGDFKLSQKKLQKIALPLIQFIISSHSSELPSTKEFTNLCKWLVESNSDSLTSYALDILNNVFGSVFTKEQVYLMYSGTHRYNMLKKENTPSARSRLKLYDEQCEKFCKKWGLENLGCGPDWYEGFELIRNAFNERFAAIQVNGLPGLD